MLRSQRIFLIVGLLLIAALLHFRMCDWVFRSKVDRSWTEGFRPIQSLLFTWRHSDNTHTGLITRWYFWPAEAIALGVAAPLLLVLAAGYLMLGARRSSRAMRGQCVTCGYDLRAAPGPLAKCPECGTPVR